MWQILKLGRSRRQACGVIIKSSRYVVNVLLVGENTCQHTLTL